MAFINYKTIDLYIKNNEEKYNYENIKSNFKNGVYNFIIDNDKYILDTNKKELVKENDESILNINFNKGKECISYYIKAIDSYLDMDIKLLNIIIDKDIIMEYKLWSQGEEIGFFKFELKEK